MPIGWVGDVVDLEADPVSELIARFPNGDRKYPSHIELEVKGWIRGEHPNRACNVCGEMCEWWGRAPIGSGEWTLFNGRTTTRHSET